MTAPLHQDPAGLAWARYRRMMRWMALAAVAAIALALAFLGFVGGGLSPHMIGATILGVGLSVLVGSGLMGLVFLSSASGHDDNAGGKG